MDLKWHQQTLFSLNLGKEWTKYCFVEVDRKFSNLYHSRSEKQRGLDFDAVRFRGSVDKWLGFYMKKIV